MAYSGQPGQPGPAPQAPAGGYQLNPAELRYPLEIPVMIGSWAVVLVALVLFGVLLKIIIPLIIGLAVVAATLYFSAQTKLIDAIQVGPQQFPEIARMAQESAYRLSMPVPQVYVRQNPFYDAEALDIGRKNGTVTLSTAQVEQFTAAEIQFLMSRQFGHIKCRHTSWSILHQNSSGDLLGAVGGVIKAGLMAIFTWWNRTTELTADRAGLIGGQDVRAGISAILKEMVGPQIFAQINVPALLEQLQELEGNPLARVSQAAALESQPYAMNRIRELLRFYKSPLYQNLAARQGKSGTTMLQVGPSMATGQLFDVLAHQVQAQVAASESAVPGQPAQQSGPVCRNCHQPLRPGARFCAHCGAQQT